MTNYIFMGVTVAIVGAAGFFFKIQSDQIDQLTRIEEAQKLEIDHFRKQLKALTDQELQEKSKQDALSAATAKLASDESQAAISREQAKLQALIDQRQAIETPGANRGAPQGAAPVAEDRLTRKAELSAHNQRHQERLAKIKSDQQKIAQLNQKIQTLSQQKKANASAKTEIAKLNTDIHQYRIDITNLRSTDQSDEESLKETLRDGKKEVGNDPKRASGIKADLLALDAQIKSQESVIQDLQAKAELLHPNSAPTEKASPAQAAPETQSAGQSSGQSSRPSGEVPASPKTTL